MFIIEKLFHFEAAHHLDGLPETHPCSRVHGHSYQVIFTFKKTVLDTTGFVVDYRELDLIKHWIDNKLDHRDLNTIVEFNPTAENLAKFFYDSFAGTFSDLATVTVKETEKTAATYEPYKIEHRKPSFTR